MRIILNFIRRTSAPILFPFFFGFIGCLLGIAYLLDPKSIQISDFIEKLKECE
jgi:hypothetical protein